MCARRPPDGTRRVQLFHPSVVRICQNSGQKQRPRPGLSDGDGPQRQRFGRRSGELEIKLRYYRITLSMFIILSPPNGDYFVNLFSYCLSTTPQSTDFKLSDSCNGKDVNIIGLSTVSQLIQISFTNEFIFAF